MRFLVFFTCVSCLIGFTVGFTRGAIAIDDKMQEMQTRGDLLEGDLKACRVREQRSTNVDLFAPQPIGHEPMKAVCRNCS